MVSQSIARVLRDVQRQRTIGPERAEEVDEETRRQALQTGARGAAARRARSRARDLVPASSGSLEGPSPSPSRAQSTARCWTRRMSCKNANSCGARSTRASRSSRSAARRRPTGRVVPSGSAIA